MKITIDNIEKEFETEKANRIYNKQKEYISKLNSEYFKTNDYQGLLFTWISLNDITKSLVERLIKEFGRDKIFDILEGKEVRFKEGED